VRCVSTSVWTECPAPSFPLGPHHPPNFAAPPSIVAIENRAIGNQCAGFVTISIPGGVTVTQQDFIRIEGIRGRIDASAALANISGRVSTLKLTALFIDGTQIAGTGVTNPALLTLAAGQQVSFVDTQIFGAGFRNGSPVGWIKVEGDVPQVTGLGLYFNATNSRLENAGISSDTATTFVLPELSGRGDGVRAHAPLTSR
jgi:hypothetical protein